jgi:outer membrane protein assembly factor BamB
MQRDASRGWIVACTAVAVLASACSGGAGGSGGSNGSPSSTTRPAEATSSTSTTAAPTTTTTVPPYDGWVDPASSGQPYGDVVDGLITFRGNPTRSYYGKGPVPKAPEVLWRYPGSGGMCGESSVGDETKTWCGSGWTGEPAVFVRDGRTWVVFGAYDKDIHFLDAANGEEILGGFGMGDIIKGSVTQDPDGFPLLYSGSRADFHVIAEDRPDGQPADLWSMTASDVSPTKWNNDWDSSPLVLGDHLFEGGENGQWYVIKLNRQKGPDGLIAVDPQIQFHAPGWDDQLLADLAGSGSRRNDVSIENSLAISGNTVYFANSGGLVQGWDISGVEQGEDPTRVFRFWTGDDTDASIVIDAEGMLYVASERERASSHARSDEVGQLMKLDPSKPEDPLVWSIKDPASDPPQGECEESACFGFWGTPAISDGVLYAATNHGRFFGASMATGEILWEKELPGPTWQSPVVVDDTLIMGDCSGVLHAYDVADPQADPPELWTVELSGCIESTPAVFGGRIFVGTRGGSFYAIGDA